MFTLVFFSRPVSDQQGKRDDETIAPKVYLSEGHSSKHQALQLQSPKRKKEEAIVAGYSLVLTNIHQEQKGFVIVEPLQV